MSQPQPLDPAIVAVLRPAIIQILNNADLSSVSAKKVRAQLAQLPPHALPPTLDLSASKKQVDEVIRDCFDQISKGMPTPPQATHSYNGASSAPPSSGLALPGLGGVRGGHTPAPSSTSSATAKPAPAKSAPAKSSASNGSKPKAEPKPKKKAAKKRAAADDDDEDEPRKKRAANPNNPFNRPLILSPKLAEVCGGDEVRVRTRIEAQPVTITDTTSIPTLFMLIRCRCRATPLSSSFGRTSSRITFRTKVTSDRYDSARDLDSAINLVPALGLRAFHQNADHLVLPHFLSSALLDPLRSQAHLHLRQGGCRVSLMTASLSAPLRHLTDMRLPFLLSDSTTQLVRDGQAHRISPHQEGRTHSMSRPFGTPATAHRQRAAGIFRVSASGLERRHFQALSLAVVTKVDVRLLRSFRIHLYFNYPAYICIQSIPRSALPVLYPIPLVVV